MPVQSNISNITVAGKEVLTSEEAALYMGISRSTLYKMTHSSAIPFYRPNGKLIYFDKSELLGWMRWEPLRNFCRASYAQSATLHVHYW